MNTDTMELNINEMEAVSGGFDWDHFAGKFEWKDFVEILVFGPIAELRPAGKVITALAWDED